MPLFLMQDETPGITINVTHLKPSSRFFRRYGNWKHGHICTACESLGGISNRNCENMNEMIFNDFDFFNRLLYLFIYSPTKIAFYSYHCMVKNIKCLILNYILYNIPWTVWVYLLNKYIYSKPTTNYNCKGKRRLPSISRPNKQRKKKNFKIGKWRDGAEVKNICCSCRWPEFSS